MNRTEVANNLFDSIDVIVDRKLQKLSFDRCVLMQIVAPVSNNEGKYHNKYVVKNQNYKTEAYALNGYKTYNKGDMVWILIPQNSYKREKFILGQVDLYYKEDAPAQVQELQDQIAILQNQVKELQSQVAALRGE